MSDDSKNATRPGTQRPEPISVHEIRFCVKDGRDINLAGAGVNGGKDILQAGAKFGGTIEIDYKPWIRHHHVRFYEGEGKNRVLKSECMIHETWVTWTPIADETP